MARSSAIWVVLDNGMIWQCIGELARGDRYPDGRRVGFTYGAGTGYETEPCPGEPSRGRDVSDALTEVRTVLSRAESAITRLDYYKLCEGEIYHRNARLPEPRPDGTAYEWQEYAYEPDPDTAEMQAALGQVVALLERWRKTGRPKP